MDIAEHDMARPEMDDVSDEQAYDEQAYDDYDEIPEMGDLTLGEVALIVVETGLEIMTLIVERSQLVGGGLIRRVARVRPPLVRL